MSVIIEIIHINGSIMDAIKTKNIIQPDIHIFKISNICINVVIVIVVVVVFCILCDNLVWTQSSGSNAPLNITI